MTTPAENLVDFVNRTEAYTPYNVDDLEDTTTPEEMYGGVIGHRAPPTEDAVTGE